MGAIHQALVMGTAGGGSPDFDPTTISGCTLWLAASNMSGFADGDPVGGTGDEWVNAGSFGGNWTQGTANRRPTYQTNERNTRPVVRFVNTPVTEEDRLSGGTGTNYFPASAYTVFAVVKSTAGGGTDASARYYRRPAIIKDANSSFHLGIYDQKFSLNHNTTTGGKILTSSNFTLNDWYIVEAYFSGGTAALKANNSTPVTFAASNLAVPGLFSLAISTDAQFDGDMAEVIAWDNDIGSTNRDTVRNGLAAKYAITV